MFQTPLHRSLGATTEILRFLPPAEVLRCQQLSRWMYRRGVARCQSSFGVVQEPAPVPAQEAHRPRDDQFQFAHSQTDQLQPRTVFHSPAHRVWVVADFLEADGRPTWRTLDYLEPRAEGWAEVRTEPDAAGVLTAFTFV